MTSLRQLSLGRSVAATTLFCALILVGSAQTSAGPASTQPAAAAPATTPPAPVQPLAPKAAPKPTMTEEEFRAAFIASLNKPQPEKSEYGAIVAAIIGVVISALASFLVTKITVSAGRADTKLKAEQEKEKAKIDTALAYTTKMLNLKMRQLEFFYAPLLACTQQCKGIHAKLTHYLFQKAPPDTYRWHKDEKGGEWLEIKHEGVWGEYRLLDQLPVLKTDPRAMALVDQILEIDAEMVKIIRRHNGLAAVETTISPLYGKFLGHYAVLSLERKGPAGTAYAPKSQEIGYYPRELDALIDDEYNKARCAVREYLEMSNTALQWLKKVKE